MSENFIQAINLFFMTVGTGFCIGTLIAIPVAMVRLAMKI